MSPTKMLTCFTGEQKYSFSPSSKIGQTIDPVALWPKHTGWTVWMEEKAKGFDSTPLVKHYLTSQLILEPSRLWYIKLTTANWTSKHVYIHRVFTLSLQSSRCKYIIFFIHNFNLELMMLNLGIEPGSQTHRAPQSLKISYGLSP